MARKLRVIVAVAALATSLFAASASVASGGADGDHKILICHVTHSESNPYVVIEVDQSAFDGNGDNDHSQHVFGDYEDVEYNGSDCGGVTTSL